MASKFTHCAREYFDALDLPVELVHLNGSVELGPITGMSEAIVDLVATGRTLRDNGLIAIEDLFNPRPLVGHPLSMRLDGGPWPPLLRLFGGLLVSVFLVSVQLMEHPDDRHQ